MRIFEIGMHKMCDTEEAIKIVVTVVNSLDEFVVATLELYDIAHGVFNYKVEIFPERVVFTEEEIDRVKAVVYEYVEGWKF